MLPSHTKLQAETFSASDATFNPKRFSLPVKSPARKAFHRAETTVKAIDHPLDQSVANPIREIPEANFIASLNPMALHRQEMLGGDPFLRFYLISYDTGRMVALDRADNVLHSGPSPIDKSMPVQLLLAGPVFRSQIALVDQPALKEIVLNMPIIFLAYIWMMLGTICLPLGIRSVAADTISSIHMFIDRIKRQSIPELDDLQYLFF